MNKDFEVKAGCYAMHHMHKKGSGTLVFVDSEVKDGWFSISYLPHGGGSSAWPSDEFSPVIDPVFIAVTKEHKARAKLFEGEKQCRLAEREIEKWAGVVEVLKDASLMAMPVSVPMPEVED